MFKHVPNILTIIRFLLIPVIVLFALNNNYIAAIVVLTISGITDILDGYIARRFNLISDFGKLSIPLTRYNELFSIKERCTGNHKNLF